MGVTIRKPVVEDKEGWRRLFAAYQRFYRANLPTEVVDETWRRILDTGADLDSLVAEADGELIGITNYVFHISTWNERPACYLEDLFVDPTARGGGAARMLIEGVEAAARERNAFRLYWHTQEYNGAARSLYDTIVPRSSFIMYRKVL